VYEFSQNWAFVEAASVVTFRSMIPLPFLLLLAHTHQNQKCFPFAPTYQNLRVLELLVPINDQKGIPPTLHSWLSNIWATFGAVLYKPWNCLGSSFFFSLSSPFPSHTTSFTTLKIYQVLLRFTTRSVEYLRSKTYQNQQ
jgi:hypothetical protein